jgi:hypothetical protein
MRASAKGSSKAAGVTFPELPLTLFTKPFEGSERRLRNRTAHLAIYSLETAGSADPTPNSSPKLRYFPWLRLAEIIAERQRHSLGGLSFGAAGRRAPRVTLVLDVSMTIAWLFDDERTEAAHTVVRHVVSQGGSPFPPAVGGRLHASVPRLAHDVVFR